MHSVEPNVPMVLMASIVVDCCQDFHPKNVVHRLATDSAHESSVSLITVDRTAADAVVAYSQMVAVFGIDLRFRKVVEVDATDDHAVVLNHHC